MVKVTIDGVEYEVDPAVAAALAKQSPAVDALPVDEPPLPPEEIKPAIKMDAATIESITNTLEARLIKVIRADRAEVNRHAAELGEVIAICRPLLPESYRIDAAADVGTLLADAIVAKRKDLEGVVKAHRTDSGYLRGMLDMIADGVVPLVATATKADAADDSIEAAQARQHARVRIVQGGQA